MIKLTAIYTDAKTNQQYFIATGEDKLLTVSSLPDLTLLSKRELVKRANALEMTADGVIVVGDKFGDVYTWVVFTSFPFFLCTCSYSSSSSDELLCKLLKMRWLELNL